MASSNREPWPFEPAVREAVELLARGEYGALEQRSGGVRLSADELRDAVRAYGRRVVAPPREAAPPLDVVAVAGAEPPEWSVAVPLWTAEEGRSDLTLELTVRAAPGGAYAIELDNVHVL
ncbi:MAG TPA: hypothetical protein VKA84_25590 [Gemmatimonadaceae bacterium]|nr:hypothetical protein [Gemmatimonadaceae bacterium]